MSILTLLVFLHLLGDLVTGRPVHTIQSEDGDTIDCINIYEQPAFKNPSLKNHKIQRRPENFKKKENTKFPKLQQVWHENGSCPIGTVPILRSESLERSKKMTQKLYPFFFNPKQALVRQEEVSAYQVSRGPYAGTGASLCIYDPYVESNEYSMSYVAMGADVYANSSQQVKGKYPKEGRNTFAAGYMVNPFMYGDTQPRLFVFMRDDKAGACYNLDCGFIQTSDEFAFGGGFKRISTTDYCWYIYTEINKQDPGDRFWLIINNALMGYWPTEIFSSMKYADAVQWGGLIMDSRIFNLHTKTNMGNGSTPAVGDHYAAEIGDIGVNPAFTGSGSGIEPVIKPDGTHVTRPKCYDYRYKKDRPGFMYYGGPGGPSCDK